MAKTQSRDFVSLVVNGRLSSEVQIAIVAILKRMESKRLSISIKEVKRSRSSNQNAFYWGVVIPCVSQMFYDSGTSISDNAVHEYLKKRFVPEEVMIDLDGKLFALPASTADLDTMTFEDYLTAIRAWAAEYDTIIPLPKETQYNYKLKG